MTADKVNILVVDDLPEKLLVFQRVLEELGQNLITAQSGREALRLVLEHEFAVILLDVNMPEMDGFETASLIRRRKRNTRTPIIFVTAFADELHTSQGYSLGAVDYILTPVVPDILRTKVRVFVELAQMTHQTKRQAEERVALAREQAARAAAEEATRRSTFLAEASTALTNSLDYEATVRSLAQLCVPYLADLAAVTLLAEQPAPWRSELAWVVPPDERVRSNTLSSGDGPDDELRAALERVLASGKAETLDGLAVPYPPPGCGAGYDPLPTGVLRCAVLVPLLARGRTLGALTLAQGDTQRCFNPADVALAEDLAGRAAIAIDNARLYRDIQEGDRRKSEFLAMLAHELRNPLAPILTATQILKLTATADPMVRQQRDMIERQVQHMKRLLDDLLDVSRITRGKIQLRKERAELVAILEQAVETSRPLIEAKNHRLAVDWPPRGIYLEGDPARLAQVFTNLLNNAAKYTDPGGELGLSSDHTAERVTVRVRDTGVGMSAEMLACAFEPFTQSDRSLDRSQGGLGIGLTLVKTLVELHGGRVRAESEGPGKGSEFSVELPAVIEPAAAAECAPPPGGTAGAPMRRILVVDDNVDAAQSLALLLRIQGHHVQVAHDGPSALQTAGAFRPEVVLLDIGLPGMDGYQVARQLRVQPGLEKALLVAVTGYGQDADRRRSFDAGFGQHLVKPIDPDALQRFLLQPNGHARTAAE